VKSTKLIIASTLCVVLGACGTSTAQNGADVRKVESIEETRVLVAEKCTDDAAGKEVFGTIVAGVAAAVVPALIDVVPALIDKGVTEMQAWMERRAKEYSTTYSSRGAGQFYLVTQQGTVESKPGCITVVRGKFGPSGNPEGDDHVKSAHLKKLGLVERPAFLFEANLAYSNDGTIRLKPHRLYFRERAAKRARSCDGNKAGCKTLNLTFTFESPVKGKEDAAIIGVAAFSFKEVQVGTYYDPRVLKSSSGFGGAKEGMTTHWVVTPKLPGQEEIDALKQKTDDKDRRTGAFTVLATVNETEDDDDFLLFLAGVLNEKKADVTKAISDPIVAAIQEAAKDD